jgi:membrane protease YdiL (CAAX protease family)
LFATALLYSRQHTNSQWVMTAALPAFLVEAVFYLGSVFESTRIWFKQIRVPRLKAALLWISALLPYCIFSVAAGTFQRNAFYLLAVLCGVFAFWYVLLPRRVAYDIGFLVIAAAPIITRVFQRIYRSPDDTRVDILGHVMWIRLGIAALLTLREWNPGAFGFWPRAREWRAGLLWYFIFIIPIVALAVGVGDVRFQLVDGPWWRVAGIGIGTFFGILWVVALGEELFFRGVIERGLIDSWRSTVLAIAVSAVLFGSVHLGFRQFPDWRRAVTTTLLGIALGIVYARTASVRASMVTHAFVVATWRMFFR